ncbi:Uncharacterized protein QTN25_001957 [Entamoeba marina]
MLTLILLIFTCVNASVFDEAKKEVQHLLGDAFLKDQPCDAQKIVNNTTNNTVFEKPSTSYDLVDLDTRFKSLKQIIQAEQIVTNHVYKKGYKKCVHKCVEEEKPVVKPCKKFLRKYKKHSPKWISTVDKYLSNNNICLSKMTEKQKGKLAEKLMNDSKCTKKMSSTEAKLLELSNIYNSILITELARHLKLSNEEAEKLVVSLVWKKELKATIDQVEGIVFFEGHEEIDEWEGKIEKLLTTISETADEIVVKHPELN